MAKPTKGELAAIRQRGIKAGFKGDRAAVMATWKRNQGKVRGKSAAAHAKAPGQIKKLPKPPEMSTQPVGNILRASAPGGKIATGPVKMGPAPVSGTFKVPSKAQIDSVAAKAKSMTPGKASIRPIARPKAPSGPAKNMQAHKADPISVAAKAKSMTPGRVKKLLAGVQTTKLPNPGKLGFSEKKSSITRVVMPKPRG